MEIMNTDSSTDVKHLILTQDCSHRKYTRQQRHTVDTDSARNDNTQHHQNILVDPYYQNERLQEETVTEPELQLPELQLTHECSHKRQHIKLQNNTGITSDLITNSFDESGLRLSLDCSHRRSCSRTLLNASYTDLNSTSKCSDLRKISEDTSNRRAYCKQSLDNSKPDLETASICSDLRISADTSHRQCKESLDNSKPDLETASVCSDLQISTDTSHRRPYYRQSLDRSNTELDTASVCSDLQISTDTSHRRTNCRQSLDRSNTELDTASVCSDLQISTDTSHRSRKRLSMDNSKSNLEIVSVCSDLRISTDTSHRKTNCRQSLDRSNTEIDTDSVCSDLRLSTDTSHRSCNRQSLDNSKNNLETASVCSKNDQDTALICSDLRISAKTSHKSCQRQSLDISKHEPNTVSDLRVSENMCYRRRKSNCESTQESESDRQSLNNKEPSARTNSNEHKPFEKSNHRIDKIKSSKLMEVNSLEGNSHMSQHPVLKEQSLKLGLTKSVAVLTDSGKRSLTGGSSRTKRKRFRSGSDSYVFISSKRCEIGHKLDEKTMSSNESRNLLNNKETRTAQPTVNAGDNPAQEVFTENVSKTAKQTSHKHLKCLQGGTIKKMHKTAGSISHRKTVKRRTWHGMDKKEKFIQKVHHSIAKSDVSNEISGIENKAESDKDLNVSKLESIMPLTEMCNDLERKVRHQFVRRNGILYRQLCNGGIWDKVLSKYVS